MGNQVKAISLFSGIGAFEYAAKFVFGPNYRTIQFIESDPTAQRVLESNFPGIPIWDNIRTYHPTQLQQSPSLIIGGFPCTNTSSAGKREGLAGSESGLWWQMLRVVIEAQPDFVIVENPEGLIHRGLREVLAGLRMAGYQTETQILSASEFGAPHRRLRLFIIAYADRLTLQQRKGWTGWDEQVGIHSEKAKQTFANSFHPNCQRFRISKPSTVSNPQSESGLGPLFDSTSEIESRGVPVADGFPDWVAGLYLSGWWRTCPPPIDVGVEPRTRGRRDAIKLYGKSICIPQAIAVLLRLQSLLQLL